MTTPSIVPVVNASAARWFQELTEPGKSGVFAPVGVWPLLALVTAGAAGPARSELEDAIGLPAHEAAGAGRDLVAALRSMPGVAAALGLWTSARVALRDEWVAQLPDGCAARLPKSPGVAQATLNDWAAEASGGRIRVMPISLDEETTLVLASGIAVDTTWVQRFRDTVATPTEGPWAGSDIQSLVRSTPQLDTVAVIDASTGPITELRVAGDTGVDVHLLLGEAEATPAALLTAGIDVLDPAGSTRVTADALPVGEAGPGLSIGTARSRRDVPQVHADVARFDIASNHNLLGAAAAFGLASATDTSHGHFPGVALDPPLAVSSARQDAVATFSATGFEAAAVTAFGMIRAASAPAGPWYETRRVDVRFDRPFAYLAVHRDSGLVLAGGWVAEPTPAGR